ncbi:MAG: nicotinate (nicotinamide) nucleotide adenylyltransferase [Succinivibrio sp.]
MGIAILGGSFNPVHSDHVEIVKAVKKALSPEIFYLLPNATPPHKNTCQLPFELRVEMLKIAFEGIDVEISPLESDSNVSHYSFDTLSSLKSLHKGEKLFFCMGMDSLNTLDTWKRGLELINLANLVVTGRKECRENFSQGVKELLKATRIDDIDGVFEIPDDMENHIFMLNKEFHCVSSTFIRDNFKSYFKNHGTGSDFFATAEGQNVAPFLDRKVTEFILEHKLYSR